MGCILFKSLHAIETEIYPGEDLITSEYLPVKIKTETLLKTFPCESLLYFFYLLTIVNMKI